MISMNKPGIVFVVAHDNTNRLEGSVVAFTHFALCNLQDYQFFQYDYLLRTGLATLYAFLLDSLDRSAAIIDFDALLGELEAINVRKQIDKKL